MKLTMVIQFFLLTSVQFVFAAESFEYFNGARSLAMGGARIAIVNDETALITNPAALAKLRGHYLTLIDPEITLNNKALSHASQFPLQAFELQEIYNEMSQSQSKYYFQQAHIFPSMVFKHFGVGLLVNQTTAFENDSDSTNFYLNFRRDISLVTGLGLRFFGGVVKLGANARIVQRSEFNSLYSSPPSSFEIDSLSNQGAGLATDVGLIVTAPVVMFPTLALSYRDIGDTTYDDFFGNLTQKNQKPITTENQLDVALGFSSIFDSSTRVTMSYELQDILDSEFSNQLEFHQHIGAELNIGDQFFIRAGMNQGLWTAGFEYATGLIQWQFATYGEKVGFFDNEYEDRRYTFKFSVRY